MNFPNKAYPPRILSLIDVMYVVKYLIKPENCAAQYCFNVLQCSVPTSYKNIMTQTIKIGYVGYKE